MRADPDYGVVPELQRGLDRYFTFYNEERPHQSLERRTPGKCTGTDAGALAIRERRSCSHRKPSAPVKGLRCEQERLGREDRWAWVCGTGSIPDTVPKGCNFLV